MNCIPRIEDHNLSHRNKHPLEKTAIALPGKKQRLILHWYNAGKFLNIPVERPVAT